MASPIVNIILIPPTTIYCSICAEQKTARWDLVETALFVEIFKKKKIILVIGGFSIDLAYFRIELWIVVWR